MPLTLLAQAIYNQDEWKEQFGSSLSDLGFENPKQAWGNLRSLSEQSKFETLYPDFFPQLLDHLKDSYNADLALNNFERFAEKFFDPEQFYSLLTHSGEWLKALVFLFSGSQVLTDALLKNPSHIDWLCQDATLNKAKTRDVLYRDFYSLAGSESVNDNIPQLLREFKQREYIRIGLRDLLGKVSLEENVANLSDLADVCLQVAYEYATWSLKNKYGTPCYQDEAGALKESEFTVLSMGKLGGRELNYSSDIDLIYIYTSSDGETRFDEEGAGGRVLSNHEFHARQAQLLTKTIHDITDKGNVFRVDLDLRPEGRGGEVANSLQSLETYYQSWGRTWERQALIKARVSAGSEELGQQFFKMIEPFIYRKSLDFSAIAEVKGLKKRVDEDLRQRKKEKGHIKLGQGGIREVEFTVQAFQLLFGGRDIGLRTPHTLTVLKKLKERNLVTLAEHDSLQEAYIFLRNLENRVQISFGLQTYNLPKDEISLDALARKMHIPGETRKERIGGLFEQYEGHTGFVAEMFANLFQEDEDQKSADLASGVWAKKRSFEDRFSPDLMGEYGFKEPEKTFRFFKSLRDGLAVGQSTETSFTLFYKALPQILDLSRDVPDPNRAVENLVKFLDASRAKISYLNLFVTHEKLLELVLTVLGSSDMLSSVLIKQPDLIDVLANQETLYRFKTFEKNEEELINSIATCTSFSDIAIKMRKFKQAEEFRIGVRYLIKETDLPGTLVDLSSLADLYLKLSLDIAKQEIKKEWNLSRADLFNFSIFGLGKLGGEELNFGSDLDLIFVYDDVSEENGGSEPGSEKDIHPMDFCTALCRKIYQLCSDMTVAGIAYKVDSDLRPEGNQGTLVLSLKGYKDYFAQRGRIWEQQAMIRARFIAGAETLKVKLIDVLHAFTYRPKLDYGSLIEISRLRERMEKELAKETTKGKNVKLGKGGIADIEFTLQILQLMHGKKYSSLRLPNTLDGIRQFSHYGILDHQDAEALENHYLFLRNVECSLRLLSGTAGSHLPKKQEELLVLARLMGYRDEEGLTASQALMKDYDSSTTQVREFYSKNLGQLLRTSL